MRTLILCVLAAGLAGVGPSSTRAQDSDVWRAMTFHDLRSPSASDPLQTLVWPDVIRETNAYAATELKRPLDGRNALLTALSSTYRDGSRTIVVSTALSRQCESGANDANASIEPSVCPLRIAVIESGRLVSMKTVEACYADHADADLPIENRTDATFTRFDPVAGTVALRTSVGGRDAPACARLFPVR